MKIIYLIIFLFLQLVSFGQKNINYDSSGDIQFKAKNYEEAILDYSNALLSDTNNFISFYKRANAKYELQQYNEALKDYNETIRLNPIHSDDFYNR